MLQAFETRDCCLSTKPNGPRVDSSFVPSVSLKVAQVPDCWEIGGLEEIRVFLKARVADGSYNPILTEGL